MPTSVRVFALILRILYIIEDLVTTALVKELLTMDMNERLLDI